MFSCDPEELIVELDVTTSSTDVTTYGGKNGSITVTVKSGNGGYLYSLKSESNKIDNSLFINLSSDNKTSYVFENLPSDNYQITVTDNGDKKFTHSIIINEPNPDDLSVSFNYTHSVTTYGGEDGSITVTVESGYKPFEYHINDVKYDNINEYTYTFDKLSGGDYNIKVVDSLGSEKTEKLIIEEPKQLTMTLEKTNVMCFGGNDGSITISATGENGEYQYKLNNGNYQDNNVFNGLSKGQYTVWVKSSNGLSINDNIDIAEPTILSFTYEVSHPNTIDQNGTITIDANGGTPSYKYQLNDEDFNDNNVLNVKNGTHTITVMDNNGCTKSENGIIVDEFIPTPPDVNTLNASEPTGTTIILNGEVNPNGGTTSLYFEYGTSTTYGNTVNISNETGNTMVNISANLTGLNSQTTYNYRLVAINEGGTTYGDNMTFTTGYKVGDELYGGTIFKVDGFYPDQTGLISWNIDENDDDDKWRDHFRDIWGDYYHDSFGNWKFANYKSNMNNSFNRSFFGEETTQLIEKDRYRNDKVWYTPSVDELLELINVNEHLVETNNDYVSLISIYWTSHTGCSGTYRCGTAISVKYREKYTFDSESKTNIRLITDF
jgi:hypothetical protein